MEDKPGAVLHLCMITAHQHMNGQQQILAVRHCEEQALALRARATKQSPCNEKQRLEICGVELWNGGQAGCCSSSVHDYSASAYEWAATNTRQSPLAIQSYTRHLVFKYTTTSLTRCVLHSHRWFLRLIARTLLQGDCFAASAHSHPVARNDGSRWSGDPSSACGGRHVRSSQRASLRGAGVGIARKGDEAIPMHEP